MASPPKDLTVTTTDSDHKVTVTWPGGGDNVVGYLVYYHHPDSSETILNTRSHLHTFNEANASQRVYAVSVQALSEHLPSEIVGPVTARGQLYMAVCHVTHCHMLL